MQWADPVYPHEPIGLRDRIMPYFGRRARILPFHPPRERRGPDRVDADGFIIDDDGPALVTCAFGRPSVGLEMDFAQGVSATLSVSDSDILRELERLRRERGEDDSST